MRNAILILAAILAIVSTTSATQASYLYSWSATPTASDGVDNALTKGRDIYSGVWFGMDDDYYYFRMDLLDAPTTVGNSYSGMYGIYIDAIPNAGASGGDSDYIPTGLNGVDYILDSHFSNYGSGTWDAAGDHFHHSWNGTGFQIGAIDATQKTENGGKTLEWQIARSKIGSGPFTFWAATHDVGSSAPTYDLAPDAGLPGIQVPEPASLAMLGLALVGLLLWRRVG